MKLIGVCIETENVKGLRDFYQLVFEKKATGNDIHCEFSEEKLAIYNPVKGEGRTLESEKSNFVLMYETNDVENLYSKLKSDYKIFKSPEDKPWGVRAFSVIDPDGNRVNFLQPLSKNETKSLHKK